MPSCKRSMAFAAGSNEPNVLIAAGKRAAIALMPKIRAAFARLPTTSQ